MALGAKILVVDDDQFIRQMANVVLGNAGYQMSFAEDGETGVAMATAERPDIVISDGLLPKLHGFLVCKAVKALEHPPKVVLMTGVYTKPTYRWEVKKEYGADAILSKPVAPRELISCIEELLGSASPVPTADAEAAGAGVEGSSVAEAQAAPAAEEDEIVETGWELAFDVDPSGPAETASSPKAADAVNAG